MSKNQNFKTYIVEIYIILKELWVMIKQSVKQYWYVSLVVCLIFSFLAIKKYRATEMFFKAKTSFNYNYLHKKFYGEQIVDLNDLLRYDKRDEVASLLNISKEEVSGLKLIHAVNIYGKPLHEDLTDVRVPFYIELQFKDEQYLNAYQGGLLHYFNSSPFTSEKVAKLQEEQKNKLKLINKELELIDTMLYSKTSSFKMLSTGTDLEKVLSILETKESDKTYLKSVLEKNKAVDVLKPFYAIPVSKNSQFTGWAIIYAILCLGFSVVIPLGLFWIRLQNVKK